MSRESSSILFEHVVFQIAFALFIDQVPSLAPRGRGHQDAGAGQARGMVPSTVRSNGLVPALEKIQGFGITPFLQVVL